MIVLEGEGLANDATALVLYRFAVVAVSLGTFSFGQAAGSLVAILVGEIIWGIGVGWLMLRLRRWVRDPKVEIMLSILTPYAAYWPPEQLGGSGVLATVAAGLYISWNGLRLISAATRLQGVFFWDFLVYLIEGLVFLITGLQIRAVISAIAAYSISSLAMAAAVVSVVVIAARFAWVYPAAYISRLIPAVRRRDPLPSWQWLFALGFTGIRGVVSLAAALAIPYIKADGSPFPDRDLILFLTFCVIFVTLVGEGLTLPWVTRALGLAHAGRRERQEERSEEFRARKRALEAAIHELDRLTTERQAPELVVRPIRVAQSDRLKLVDHRNDGDARHKKLVDLGDDIELSLIEAERDFINNLYRDGELKDEQRRHIERELDLRDANLANLRSTE